MVQIIVIIIIIIISEQSANTPQLKEEFEFWSQPTKLTAHLPVLKPVSYELVRDHGSIP